MRILKAIILLSCIYCAGFVKAQSLETIGQLARDGAPNLALRLMDQIQPKADTNTPGWIFFERQRFAIMQNWQQWQFLVDRYNSLPDELPEDFMLWAKLQKVDALIKLNQTHAARHTLRELIWQSENKDNIDIPLIRRLIIRSYLIDNNLQDVDLAMRHYERDYGNKGAAWKKLRARVLLRNKQSQDAYAFLSFVSGKTSDLKSKKLLDHEAVAMRLLVELRSKSRTAKSVLGDVRSMLNIKKLVLPHQQRYLAVGAEAAKEFGGLLTRVRLLEQALPNAHLINRSDSLFALSGDDLWQAYEDYALAEGNRQKLLIGQDQSWLDEARKWSEKRPEKARAFYSIVMHQGVDEEKKDRAYRQFIALLNTQETHKEMIQPLFMSKRRYPSADAIPLFIRYQLIDDAIAKQNIDRASELMLNLDSAPAEADKFNWGLRRARVLILGGKVDQGRDALINLFNAAAMDVTNTGSNPNNKDKPFAPVDAYLQVVFDLQKVDDHKGAISLFTQLLQKPLPGEAGKALRREVLFWIADSHKAEKNTQRNPVLAAAFYLRSATLLDSLGNDPWGQTARFQAAEVLAAEGIIDDARRIYSTLLKATKEPARRAMIKYRLQELWLNKKSES